MMTSLSPARSVTGQILQSPRRPDGAEDRPPAADDQLQVSMALLKKWNGHEDDMLSRVCTLHRENERLRVLLKLVYLQAGGAWGDDTTPDALDKLDPTKDLPHDKVVQLVQNAVEPRTGEGRWFESQLRIRKLEARCLSLEQETTAAITKERAARQAATSLESRVRSLQEDLDACRARLHEVENELRQTNEKNTEQVMQILRLKESLDEAREDAAKSDATISKLNERIASQSSTLRQLSLETAEQSSALRQANLDKERLSEYVASLVQEQQSTPARTRPASSTMPPVTSQPGSAVLYKQPGGKMGLLWAETNNGLVLRGVDPASPAFEAGCTQYLGWKLIGAAGEVVQNTAGLSAATLGKGRVELLFERPPDDSSSRADKEAVSVLKQQIDTLTKAITLEQSKFQDTMSSASWSSSRPSRSAVHASGALPDTEHF